MLVPTTTTERSNIMAKLAPQKFLSNDGKEFDSALEADAHDLALIQADSVNAYIKEAGLAAAEGTRAKRYISGYAAFVAAQNTAQTDEA